VQHLCNLEIGKIGKKKKTRTETKKLKKKQQRKVIAFMASMN